MTEPTNNARLRHNAVDTLHALADFRRDFPAIYQGITEPRDAQRPALELALGALKSYSVARVKQAPGKPAGVIFAGPTGTGKTALACLVAHFAAAVEAYRPAFIACRDAKMDLVGLPSTRRRETQDYQEAGDPLNTTVLVLDDIGAEKGNAEAEALVRWLLDVRTREPAFTVGTTNLTRPELYQHLGGEREWSRLGLFTFVDFRDLPDYRTQH